MKNKPYRFRSLPSRENLFGKLYDFSSCLKSEGQTFLRLSEEGLNPTFQKGREKYNCEIRRGFTYLLKNFSVFAIIKLRGD